MAFRQRHMLLLVVLASALLAVVAAGCGGSSDSGSSDTTTPADTSAPADTGALRAQDETTGRVLWTFFPPELGQARSSGDLMTSIEVLRFDANADGVIDTAGGDRVWLYFGLKRGGPWYYALDVTGRAPRVRWKAGSSQLDGLGEAWSTPTIARVQIAGALRRVRRGFDG